jgi:hypothetical protein
VRLPRWFVAVCCVVVAAITLTPPPYLHAHAIGMFTGCWSVSSGGGNREEDEEEQDGKRGGGLVGLLALGLHDYRRLSDRVSDLDARCNWTPRHARPQNTTHDLNTPTFQAEVLSLSELTARRERCHEAAWAQLHATHERLLGLLNGLAVELERGIKARQRIADAGAAAAASERVIFCGGYSCWALGLESP